MRSFFLAIALLVGTASAYGGLTGFDARLGSGGYGSGGAFSVELRADENPVPAGLQFGMVGGVPQTLCVEATTFNTGVWWEATVDSSVLYGTNSPPTQLSYLHQVTRNLYAEYVLGTTSISGQTLAAYVGTDGVRNRAMQNLIWQYQQTGLSNGTGGGIAAAMTYILTNWGNSSGASVGASNVRVLNLWGGPNDYQGDKQSHLVYYVPVPAAALLGVLGLGIVGWVKRRMA